MSVLTINEGNEQALKGFKQIMEKYLSWGLSAVKSDNLNRAEKQLAKLEGLEDATTVQEQLRNAIRTCKKELVSCKPQADATYTKPGKDISAEGKRNFERTNMDQARELHSSFTDPITGMEFVYVLGGCFMMGQTVEDKRRIIAERGEDTYNKYFFAELPQHRVCVDGFYIGKYEVTNGQYRMYKYNHNSGRYKGESLDNDKQPVVEVNWKDAISYAKWLSKNSRKEFSLPTEAQWEYAARAATSTVHYWGDSINATCQYANVNDQSLSKINIFSWGALSCNDGYAVSSPVGTFKANRYGLYDMLGNVWEWCSDWYATTYYSYSPRDNPHGPTTGFEHVFRGGSWDYQPGYVRAATRNGPGFAVRGHHLGFRLVFTDS